MKTKIYLTALAVAMLFVIDTMAQCFVTEEIKPNATQGIDAVINSNSPNTNFGTYPDLDAMAGTFSLQGVTRGLLRFDLSAFPTNTIVQSATLTLANRNGSVNNSGHHTIGNSAAFLQKVTSSWNESTVTWNNQPTTATLNQITLPAAAFTGGDYNLDVTAFIQTMISNPATNFGFMLRLQTETATRALIFGSSDADSFDWPMLTITYSIATPLTATIYTFSGGGTVWCSTCPNCGTQFFVNRGPDFTYQWRLNGINIPEANDTTYFTTGDTGSYDCVITSPGCGTAVSNSIHTYRVDPPTVTVTPDGPSFAPIQLCYPDSVTLTANTGFNFSYQWKFNDVNIPGATSVSYQAKQAGVYRCLVDNGCFGSSQNVNIEIVNLTTKILQPGAAGKDAYVSNLSSEVNTNFGSSPDLPATRMPIASPSTRRSLLMFDLSSLPANTVIQEAKLTLFNNPTSTINAGSHAGLNSSFLQRIISPWDENTVTWNTQPTTTTVNQISLPLSSNAHQNYIIDVTTMVKDMVANPASNFGFLLRQQSENPERILIFSSSDNSNSALWPKLEITFAGIPDAVITADGPTSFCPAGSVLLYATPSNTNAFNINLFYQWRLNGVNLPDANSSLLFAFYSGNYDCVVSSMCSNVNSSVSNTITANQFPYPSATYNSPVCAGTTLNLSVSAGESYSWSGPDGFTSTLQNPVITGVTSANSGVYFVMVTNDVNGCTNLAGTNVNILPSYILYQDADADGYGNNLVSNIFCTFQTPGYVSNNADCNDNDASIHSMVQYFVDADHDGFGSTATAMLCASTPPVGYSTDNTDCNDNDASVHAPVQYYIDADHDGFGSTATAMVCASTPPVGYSTDNTDCNDNDASVHSPVQYYVDADHDGFGSTATAMVCASSPPTGYSTNNTDCNDNNAAVHPEGAEVCSNGIDDNCNGQIDEGCCSISVSAGVDETLYFGYAPDQCVSKTAVITSGAPPYTYSWTLDRALLIDVITPTGDETMTGANSATVTVCLMDTAALCITVTDAHGCSANDCATIYAEDVRCFAGNNQKVTLCWNNNTICVNSTAVNAHLAQGAYLGPCNSQRLSTGTEGSDFTIYPNPGNGIFDLQMSSGNFTRIEIYDMLGNLVFNQRNSESPAANLRINLSQNSNGVYFITVKDENNNLTTKKIVKM